jgi:hypothetical protein
MNKTAESTDTDNDATPPTRVVQYVRKSSEHPHHSAENQLRITRRNATSRKMTIVVTFTGRDTATSGYGPVDS